MGKKYIFGTVKVGEKGQIVIPKFVRRYAAVFKHRNGTDFKSANSFS
ncbi:AbrB/MazE/SpoVT family DNA-binding domain-containing protein [Paenibacillus sp. MER TA 81-3]|nr:AbrB/MazE/SpoVT family DNA-binding domain-containing protein [Paenibacillus sp. MER TA 81-3]MCM3340726.1 AbrB/MazE/SpoVT family DNA-binding domain-containing protein [Paenibacillus sp. MER TA 81-3]